MQVFVYVTNGLFVRKASRSLLFLGLTLNAMAVERSHAPVSRPVLEGTLKRIFLMWLIRNIFFFFTCIFSNLHATTIMLYTIVTLFILYAVFRLCLVM